MGNCTPVNWFGIDAGKKDLHVSSSFQCPARRTGCFANDASGYKKLLAWALKHAPSGSEVRFCMESTGDYGVGLALYLSESGFHVSVENPCRVKYYGIYKGRLNKTDRADAKLIADFAADSNPNAWPMSDPLRRRLFRLCRRRQQLLKLENMESNRRECPEAVGPECLDSISLVLKTVRAQIRAVEEQIAQAVGSDPELQRSADLLATIPVFAAGTAHVILAEMPPVDSCDSAKSWAACSGTNPVNSQSGSQAGTGRMSRGGRRAVRKQCWMPALVGLGKMDELRDLYDRLRDRGKTHRQALTACVRKLLMISYGVLKSQKPYQAPAKAKTDGNLKTAPG